VDLAEEAFDEAATGADPRVDLLDVSGQVHARLLAALCEKSK